MKRNRSDIPTGASLFRELKLKRQRLSMLLNRDINDVLSSTSSSDTGDHGSDVDAGPPLMLREDSACFESRRHDAVDSGASSDGDWSFCGNGYSTRHPLMLIPDHTRVLSSHTGQFGGHPSGGDRKSFAVGKPDVESVSMTTRGVDFGQINMSANLSSSSSTEFPSPRVNVSHDSHGLRLETEVNSSALSRFRSGASIWLHHDTFRHRQNDNGDKHSHKPDGLTFDPQLVKDVSEAAGSIAGYVQETDHIQDGDHNAEVQVSDYGRATDHIQVIDHIRVIAQSTQDSNSGQVVSTLSVPSTLQPGTPSLTSGDQSCGQTDPVLCKRSSHLETRSVIQHGSDLVVSVKLEEKLCDSHVLVTSGGLAQGDKPVLDWSQLDQLKHTQETSYSAVKSDKADPDKQQLVCEICTDRASGLHYGIISCEGCKGFFKRTVQNKRVYSCIANGDCQVTKLRRNRCQYCRFKKCLLKGMVLAAVRDDRMPGGRNSGAVYSLYKVKYRKPGRTTDASSRRTAVRRLKSVAGAGSSKHSQSVEQTDHAGQTLWLQPDIAQARPDTHADTYLCRHQLSAGFGGRLVHGADSITVSEDMSADSLLVSQDRNVAADMSADSLRVSQDRNVAADMTADMSHESVAMSNDSNVSGSHQFSVNHDSSSHDTFMTADNSNVSQYSNINVNNPRVCYDRNTHADGDGAPVSRYPDADTDRLAVNRYLSADSPTVSRYLNADSSSAASHYVTADNPSVISLSVRYADSADMNHSRRSVIADSREMQTEAIYDGRHSNNRHSNEDANHGRSSHLAHIEQLLQCEQTHDLATATQPYSGAALSTLLRHLSDNVVRELVKWMKTLPFYDRLPMSVHRQCLAEKWYDLLLLTMLVHQASSGHPDDLSSDDINSHVARNVMRLQHGLRHVLEHEMPVDELYREVGDIVQKLTDIVLNLRRLGLTREEYVCLKVILLLTHESGAETNETAEHIEGIYRDVLRQLVADTFPHEPTRFTELLLQLPHIQTASALLMKTNTIYIPSMLNAPVQ